MAGDGDLVVRENLLGVLTGSAPGVVWDVRGTAGAGKSVLLRETGRRAGRRDVVLQLEMQDYFTAFEQGGAAVGQADGLGGELRRFGRALSALVDGLLDQAAERGALAELLNDIGEAARAASGLAEAEAQAEQLTGRIRDEVNRLTGAKAAAGGRVFLLADDFHLVTDRPFGRWFSRLVAGLDGAVVVVGRRIGGSGVLDPPILPSARVLEVGGLTADEVRDYLARRLGAPGREIAAVVYDSTRGHALAVGLSADLAADMHRRGEPVTANGLLKEVTAQSGQEGLLPDTPLGKLVGRFIQSANARDPAIGQGLDCLWAVRRFDVRLLKTLLAVGEGPAGGYRLAEQLVSYSFVEQRTRPGRPAEPYYVVHEHVRELCLGMLAAPTGDPGRLQELHRVAEKYYSDRTGKFAAGYEGWFRYSDPSWQALVREWLYHVSQLDSDGEANGRRGLAKLFIDAFWWWGNYVPFAFCEELLADWAEMAESRQGTIDLDWGNWLREVYLRYPKGWRAEATTDDWLAIKKRLSDFLDHPEIAAAEPYNSHMRHVRGMLHLFLAIVERHLNPRNQAVAEHFQQARALFAADDDQWNVAWVSYHEADAALGRGDAQAAAAAAEAGWREPAEPGENDFELAANFHRVHADAAWLRGERGLALDLYARAALSAYKFQVAVVDPDIAPAVEYTQAFMTEMHERVAERLSALHEAGQDATAREACARIRRFFDPYWRAAGQADFTDPVVLLAQGQAAEVVAGLFPPPPAQADLHRVDTQYALTATEVLYDMEDELAEPPGTPLPTTAE
jgi:hypothetical protein